jgi:protein TonB
MPMLRVVLAIFVFASGSTLFAQAKDSSELTTDEKIVYVAEIIPVFSYNGKGISEFIIDNLKYPQIAIDRGIEAKVIVDFVVDTLGRVTNVVSVDNGNARIQVLVDEAIRVMKSSSGYWKPGYTNGKKVRMKMRIPITFKLE